MCRAIKGKELAEKLGITVEELNYYKDLKDKAEMASMHLVNTNNEKLRHEYNGSIDAMVQFEKDHCLSEEMLKVV